MLMQPLPYRVFDIFLHQGDQQVVQSHVQDLELYIP